MSYIALSGNIAVGKSTVLSQLEERGYTTVEENLGPEFMSLLSAYNEDSTTAINLQTYINAYRVLDAEASGYDDELRIHERSIMDDIIFTNVMMGNNEIEEDDYLEFMQTAVARLSANPPAKVIYLYADPVKSYDRMVARNRSEESQQTIVDIAMLEQAHQRMLPMLCKSVGAELLQIDWTEFGDIDKIIELIEGGTTMMLPVKMIGEIEREYMAMGYKYEQQNFIAGWSNGEEFVRFNEEAHFLKEKGMLKGWKYNEKLDEWKEDKKYAKR